LILPRSLLGRRLRDVLGNQDNTSIDRDSATGRVDFARLFASLPVALLEVG
jgi:hypothetical protein